LTGAYINVERISTDTANTVVVSKSSAVTGTEAGYFHYTGSGATGYNLAVVGNDVRLQQIIGSAAVYMNAPSTGATPNTAAPAGGTGYSCSTVAWTPADNPFLDSTIYTATVALTASSGYAFGAGITATINGQAAGVLSNPDGTITLSLPFPSTGADAVAGISIKTQPATLTYNHGDALDLSGLEVTLTYSAAADDDVPLAQFTNFGIIAIPANGSILDISQDNTVIAVSCGSLTAQTGTLTVNAAAISSVEINVTAPVTGETPDTLASGAGRFSVGAVSWSGSSPVFLGSTQYTAEVRLTADTGYSFAGLTTAKINGYPATLSHNPDASVTLSYQFAATDTAAVTGISVDTQPSTLTYTHGQALDLSGLLVTLTYYDGTTANVAPANFGTNGITANPANGAALSLSTHNGRPVTLSCDGYTADTNDLTVSAAVETPAAGGGDSGSSGGGYIPPTTPPDGGNTTQIGGGEVTTPTGQDPIVNGDGSITLPGGGTITTPGGGNGKGGSTIVVPPGTIIDSDGRISFPPGSGGYRITDSYGNTFNVPEDAVIILDMDTPLGYFISINNPYADVDQSDWFIDAVMFVYGHGLMIATGTNPMMFSPNAATTRGMIVTILYRMAGSPDVSGELREESGEFTDVDAGMWYYDAVVWAAANGIVSGYGGGLFGPEDYITREQLAVILGSYAAEMGMTLPMVRDYSGFHDDAGISDYAKEAVEYFFRAGIISGKPGNVFDPQGTATRAEVATMIMRFLEAAAEE